MSIYQPTVGDRRSTLWGVVAIFFWSTTIAFSRSLTEQLGTFTAPALIYSAAGIIGLLLLAIQPNGLVKIRQLPMSYLFGCGGLFVLYMVSLYLAIGIAVSHTQVLVVGLINYLWPGLSLIFSIPLLGKRGKPLLLVGILIALSGIWLATGSMEGLSLATLTMEKASWAPYGLAMIAAICWGLYSNLSRRWAAENDAGAVPVFLLCSGLALGCLRFFSIETTAWNIKACLELAYMAIFPGMLAYILWDRAVRKGEILLVASLSYITPLLSTLFSVIMLDVRPNSEIWMGAALVVGGAILCKTSIVD